MKSPCFLSSPGLLGLIFISWLVVLPKAFSDDASASDHQVFEHCSDSESHRAQPLEPMDYSIILYVVGGNTLLWGVKWSYDFYAWIVAQQQHNLLKSIMDKNLAMVVGYVKDVPIDKSIVELLGALKNVPQVIEGIQNSMDFNPLRKAVYFIGTTSLSCFAIHAVHNPERSLEVITNTVNPVLNRVDNMVSVVWHDATTAVTYLFRTGESAVASVWHTGESGVAYLYHMAESAVVYPWRLAESGVTHLFRAGETGAAYLWEASKSGTVYLWEQGINDHTKRGVALVVLLDTLYYTHQLGRSFWHYLSFRNNPGAGLADTSPSLGTLLFANGAFLALNEALTQIPSLIQYWRGSERKE